MRRSILSLVGVLAVFPAVSTPLAYAAPPQGELMRCGQEITRTDENGTFDLRFQCLPRQGVLNWSFRLDDHWRATAISPVQEAGMQYWRDGTEQRRNSPHLEGADYLFHGTMTGVFVGDHVVYQDFLRFRVDFGPQTGTARLAVAGSVILTL